MRCSSSVIFQLFVVISAAPGFCFSPYPKTTRLQSSHDGETKGLLAAFMCNKRTFNTVLGNDKLPFLFPSVVKKNPRTRTETDDDVTARVEGSVDDMVGTGLARPSLRRRESLLVRPVAVEKATLPGTKTSNKKCSKTASRLYSESIHRRQQQRRRKSDGNYYTAGVWRLRS